MLGSAHCATLLEAFPAEDRAALRRAKRNGGFFAALRAVGLGLCPHGRRSAASRRLSPFCFTPFAALRFVLEPLVGEKHLFAGSKNELAATLRTLQHLIVVFHEPLPLDPARTGDASLAQ